MTKTNHKLFVFTLKITVAALSLSACAPVGQSPVGGTSDGASKNGGVIAPQPETPPVTSAPTPTADNGQLSICSKLDFKGVSWPTNLPVTERDPFALAMNITGSFEGTRGFTNLTGNFDGQGVSMGLLQQNFGQGSLQPLMIQHTALNIANFKSFFTKAHTTSLLAMLTRWGGHAIVASLRDLEDAGFSALDDPELVLQETGFDMFEAEKFFTAAISRNTESVNWAKANVLSGTKIKSDWARELGALAASPLYRSLQVERAGTLHRKALSLFNYFKMTDVRSYLFFFDIIIQNGGINESMKSALAASFARSPTLTETQKLKAILEKRLTLVRAQYVEDVRRRKTSLINGKGTVHGATRDYGKEFCASLFSDL